MILVTIVTCVFTFSKICDFFTTPYSPRKTHRKSQIFKSFLSFFEFILLSDAKTISMIVKKQNPGKDFLSRKNQRLLSTEAKLLQNALLSGHASHWGFSLRSAFYRSLAAVKRSLDIRRVSEPFVTNSYVQDVLPLRFFVFFYYHGNRFRT